MAELRERALAYAQRFGLRHAVLPGRSGSVLFGEAEDGSHGNFNPASYRAIAASPDWSRRLLKAHTAAKRSRVHAEWSWRELDCAVSSDALLMNVFCHPEVLAQPALRALLGVDANAVAQFGVKPRLPLANGRFDTSEADMQVGDLLVEAKLTESDFQTARPALVERFRDLHTVFDIAALPQTAAQIVDFAWDEATQSQVPVLRGRSGDFLHYQLIRGVLAAHASGLRFTVVCDARRADLIAAWSTVQQAVVHPGLRWRLQLLTWQETAACLPADLQRFLAEKYGILA